VVNVKEAWQSPQSVLAFHTAGVDSAAFSSDCPEGKGAGCATESLQYSCLGLLLHMWW